MQLLHVNSLNQMRKAGWIKCNALPSPALPGSGSEGVISALSFKAPLFDNPKV